jgi:acetyltransferase-like isoleucine patch superfamily enzyme
MYGTWLALNPVVSKNIRVRVPEHFSLAEGAIVDDYCYFSTKVKVGRYSHIAAGCHVGGGAARTFELGDFSSLSAGVKIWCTSDDFVNDIVMIVPAGLDALDVKEHLITGDVTLGRCTAVGSNAVVMPDNDIPEGTAIGALSFVPPRFAFEPWTVYAGTPIRRICERNRDKVLAQVERIETHLQRMAKTEVS